MSTVPMKPAASGDNDEGGGNKLTGAFGQGRGFLSEVRSEMRRVTWPSRREIYATTVVVIVTSAFFGIYLWTLDMVVDRAIRWVFRSLGAA